jgi:diguanylate cyclase (GGDEF)-like protein
MTPAGAGPYQDLIGQLVGNELLRGLGRDDLERVARHATPLDLARGEVLLSPERENEFVYLLLDGTLSIHFGTPDSPEISDLGKGASVGEISVIDDGHPTAYVIAKTPCRVHPMPRALVLDLIDGASPFARNMLRQISRWVRTNKHYFVQARMRIEELTNAAHLDALTGLYNRRWLDRALPRLLEVEAPHCLLMIDVDRFKDYNDTHGHQGGDQALIALANVLKTTLRPYDYAARYGGEEFVVLLPNVDMGECIEVAERIRLAAAACQVRQADGQVLPAITLSIGVAAHQRGMSPKALIGAADERLYRAKADGRDCVRD